MVLHGQTVVLTDGVSCIPLTSRKGKVDLAHRPLIAFALLRISACKTCIPSCSYGALAGRSS
jgi:hypothetical protein